MSDAEDFAWMAAQAVVAVLLIPVFLVRMAWELARYTARRARR